MKTLPNGRVTRPRGGVAFFLVEKFTTARSRPHYSRGVKFTGCVPRVQKDSFSRNMGINESRTQLSAHSTARYNTDVASKKAKGGRPERVLKSVMEHYVENAKLEILLSVQAAGITRQERSDDRPTVRQIRTHTCTRIRTDIHMHM